MGGNRKKLIVIGQKALIPQGSRRERNWLGFKGVPKPCKAERKLTMKIKYTRRDS